MTADLGIETTSPRVEECIAAVMKRFPGCSPSAQGGYFEAVHQKLAPLARDLERELAQAQAAQQTAWEQLAAAKRASQQVDEAKGRDAARYQALVEAAHAHITGKPMTPQQAAVHDAVKQLGYRTGIEDLGNAIDAATAAKEPR